MSDHASALVPVRSWCYMSPGLQHSGKPIDIGLFAEALIYYDSVLVTLPDKWAFLEFVSWFVERGKYGDLIALLEDEAIKFYYYSFFSASVQRDGEYFIQNLQEKRAEDLSMFDLNCLATQSLGQVLPRTRQRAQLRRAIRGRVVEAKAGDFDRAIENARRDFQDPDRCALLLQALLDEIYPMLGLKAPPKAKSRIIEHSGKTRISWNVDFARITQALGPDLNFNPGMPLSAAARCNRLLWSAATLGCDLYLYAPMSALVGDKLCESGERLDRPQEIVEQLEAEVEFPDIRQLVNSGRIGLGEVLEFRRRSRRFRRWLQDESERDRNAIIAYHHEVAQESGWVKVGRKALALFGILGGAAVAAAVGGGIAGVPGAIAGAGIEAGLVYVFDLASRLDEDWQPVVFGNWARDRIRKELARDRKKDPHS
jgi:hypothetical protein